MQSVVALQRAAASASMSIVQRRTSLAKVATDLLSGLHATALTGTQCPGRFPLAAPYDKKGPAAQEPGSGGLSLPCKQRIVDCTVGTSSMT